jgi:hypothetical protein
MERLFVQVAWEMKLVRSPRVCPEVLSAENAKECTLTWLNNLSQSHRDATLVAIVISENINPVRDDTMSLAECHKQVDE